MKVIIFCVVMAVGILFTIIGFNFLYKVIQFKKLAVKTMATVIEVQTSTSKAHNVVYSPVLSFTTNDGETIKYEVSRFYFKTYKIGEQVEVLYEKNEKLSPQVNSFKHLFMPPLLTIAVGLMCILLPLSKIQYFK